MPLATALGVEPSTTSLIVENEIRPAPSPSLLPITRRVKRRGASPSWSSALMAWRYCDVEIPHPDLPGTPPSGIGFAAPTSTITLPAHAHLLPRRDQSEFHGESQAGWTRRSDLPSCWSSRTSLPSIRKTVSPWVASRMPGSPIIDAISRQGHLNFSSASFVTNERLGNALITVTAPAAARAR